ncbi:TetR/AcrR family transcriptional regulator C-terminal domain-containing protein [Dactylosporangium sp. NPDC000555]|uniref:TetR/AcrR family transcriptional regulator C-terminal domain-containing protein n=1 Tax=Dactylosporangium sp. NPDC000555 TaxID=3154260 RepID=UPI0033199AC4
MPRPTIPKLSLDAIVDAAIDLAGESGSFTMAELAAKLEVRQSSLYNHVAGRDAVVELIRQRAHEEMAVRVDTLAAWQDVVRDVARAQRDALARHPWLIKLLATSPAEPGAAASGVENLATVLSRAGFADQDVLQIIAAIDIIVIGGSLDLLSPERLFPRSVTDGTKELARAVQAAPRDAPRAEVAFAFTLDLFIDALEGRLAAR